MTGLNWGGKRAREREREKQVVRNLPHWYSDCRRFHSCAHTWRSHLSTSQPPNDVNCCGSMRSFRFSMSHWMFPFCWPMNATSACTLSHSSRWCWGHVCVFASETNESLTWTSMISNRPWSIFGNFRVFVFHFIVQRIDDFNSFEWIASNTRHNRAHVHCAMSESFEYRSDESDDRTPTRPAANDVSFLAFDFRKWIGSPLFCSEIELKKTVN